MRPGKLIILVMLAGIFAKCSKDTSSATVDDQLKINFRLVANGSPVNHTNDYLNGSGESYTVKVFKFYTGNFTLSNNGTPGPGANGFYHLANMDDSSSLTVEVPMSPGNYNQLSFTIGVDSLYNVSGAQTGALDPVNGMFWTWNTGYIFAKLEGTSSFSSSLNHGVVYHIGGFRTGENAIRQVTLDFPGDQQIVFGNGKKTEITIDVNLDQWFDGVNKLSIAATPVWMTPGGESLRIADNYATMFSIHELINR
jgi:hypothetical protein